MASSPLYVARAIAAGRRLAPWLAGPAVLMMRGDSVELAAPARCPGLLELLSIAAVRLVPTVRIGQVFGVLHIVVIVGALAAFAALVAHQTRSTAVALAVAIGVGLSPLFPATLAPPSAAAAFGVCASAALVYIGGARSGASRVAAFVLPCGVLIVAALLTPSWLYPATAIACVVGVAAWPDRGRARRYAIGIGSAAAVAVVSLAVLTVSVPNAIAFAIPDAGATRTLAACVAPVPSVAAAIDVTKTLTFWLGPFVLGLAALGAFVVAPAAGWRTSALIATVVAICVIVTSASAPPAVAVAPAAVLLWCLAGSGLKEVLARFSRRSLPQLVAALVLLLVPALSASRRVNEIRDDLVRPRGHEQQTLRQMTTLLNVVPGEATFVEEDATVDVLLRAAVFGGRRKLKPVAIVPRQPDVVERALAAHAVYAFPDAQQDLGLRGFVVEPIAVGQAGPGGETPHLDGVAAIAGRRVCRTMSDSWADVSGASGRIALNADSEAARGPVVLYLGGKRSGQPRPDGWPPRTLRGFRYFTFDQLDGRKSERLVAEARSFGLRGDEPVLDEPFVIRLILHRTPHAPRGLAAALGSPFPTGLAKLDAESTHTGRLTVCDAPAVRVSALPARE